MAGRGRDVARMLGPVGVWSFALDRGPAAAGRAFAAEVEACGYSALWFPESVGSREAFAQAGVLLGATERLVVATGIASVWARDAWAMANGQRALADAFPGRFLLGIGVSHAPSVTARGGRYERPVERMRAYLDAMDAAPWNAPAPSPEPARVLAALGPRMLALAAERADGAHTYFVPVAHTQAARAALGPEPVLAVEQAAVLSSDPAEARAIARRYAERYLALPNYASNLRRHGFADDDLVGGGSDRVIDAVIVWGDVARVAERVREHRAAGADHVALQLLGPEPADTRAADVSDLATELLG